MFEKICEVISNGEEISLDEIFADNRKEKNVFARQLIAYFSKEYGVGSLSCIGKKISKDHSTVTTSINTIKNYLDTDRIKRAKIEKYREKIEHIMMLQNKKEDMEMLINPLKKEIEALESRLINIHVMVKNIIDAINELYIEKDNKPDPAKKVISEPIEPVKRQPTRSPFKSPYEDLMSCNNQGYSGYKAHCL